MTTNDERIRRARAILHRLEETYHNGRERENLIDFFADLYTWNDHLRTHHRLELSDTLRVAHDHFSYERRHPREPFRRQDDDGTGAEDADQ